MNSLDYLRLLRRRWTWIVTATLLGALLGFGATRLQTPQYDSRASVFFTVQAADSVTELAQGSSYATNQVQSFAQIATTPLVLNKVIKTLGLPDTPAQLASRVRVTVPTKTAIVAVRVSDTDPTRAANTTNAIAKQLVATVGDLSPTDSTGKPRVKATVVTPAVIASSPASPSLVRNVGLGLLVGLFLGWLAAILRDRFDTRLRNADDLATVTDAPVVGSIPVDADRSRHPSMVLNDPTGQGAEAFRRLRTNLRFLSVDSHSHAYTVTSSVMGEGKSSTVSNLAVVMAEAGQRVLVVDCDLRRPVVDSYFGVAGGVGVTNILIGESELADVVQEGPHENLFVLAAGRIPPNPSELLGSDEMRLLAEQATAEYDVVLFDAPPLLPVTDAALLAKLTSGAILVVSLNHVRKEQVRGSIDTLGTVDADVLGVILNGVDRRSDSYGYGYYGEYKAGTPSGQSGRKSKALSRPRAKEIAAPSRAAEEPGADTESAKPLLARQGSELADQTS